MHAANLTIRSFFLVLRAIFQFDFQLCMLNPRQYDDCYYWSFDIKLEKPVIHYLDIQKVVLLNMIKQFSSPLVEFSESDLGTPIV